MERSPVDRLARTLATRRTSLGLLAALGLVAVGMRDEDVAAKRRRKRRKHKNKRNRSQDGQGTAPVQCLEPGVTCVPGTSSCCDGRTCDQTAAGAVCCSPEGTPFTSFEGCCSQTCDSLVGGGTCAPCRGRTCSATKPCCGGQTCTNGYCGGCRDRATSCTSSTQCCFSDCTSGACLSAAGGRCARDVDCRSCYLGHNCTNACVNGFCAV